METASVAILRSLGVRSFRVLVAALLAVSSLTAVGASAARAEVAPGTLPAGGSVVAGSASITLPGGDGMVIAQSSASAIIDWATFSVGAAAEVTITQPGPDSVLLLRVVGTPGSGIAASDIHGRITSNGRVFLVNSTEVLLQASSIVTVGSLVASVGHISDADFLAGAGTGQFTFEQPGTGAGLRNYGTISTGPGGTAALLGRSVSVRESGVIDAPGGTVAQVAAGLVTLDFFADGLTQLTIDDTAGLPYAFVRNDGRLTADGGQVILVTNGDEERPGVVVGDSAVVRSHSRPGSGNRIVLDAGAGYVVVGAAALDARGVDSGTEGGDIDVRGGVVFVGESVSDFPEPCAGPGACTVIDASGDVGGGAIMISGAQLTRVLSEGAAEPGVEILSDAVASGSAGTITVGGSDDTRIGGHVRISSSGLASDATGGEVLLGQEGGIATFYHNISGVFVGPPDIAALSTVGAARPHVGALLPFGALPAATFSASTSGGPAGAPAESRSTATAVDLGDGLLTFDTASVSCTTTDDGDMAGTTDITGLASSVDDDVADLDLSAPNVEIDISGLGHIILNEQTFGTTSSGRKTLTVNGMRIIAPDGEEMTLLQATCSTENTPPVANDDTATTMRDQSVTIDVLANDVDPDGDPLSVTATTQPGHGAATCSVEGACVYTPVTGFSGVDTFTYTLSDGIDASTATVTVTVIEPLEILTEVLPNGVVGSQYSLDLEIAGGTPPYSAVVTSGTLPDGLTLSPEGAISGTPSGPAGLFEFTVTVTDSAHSAQTASRELSITIDRGETKLSVDPVLLKVGGGLIKVTVGVITARLVGGDTAAGLPGEPLTVRAGRAIVCSITTGDNGGARCQLSVIDTLRVILAGGVTVDYPGSPTWQPASGKAGLL